jgi:outer membrane protein assembly factor BamB
MMKRKSVAFILAFAIVASVVAVTVNAQPIVKEIPTFIYLQLTPNPVGVNQEVYVIVFFSNPPPTAGGIGIMPTPGDRYENVTVEIIRPDGGKDILGPAISDPVGGLYFTYKPTKTGEYQFQAFYPGEILDGKSSVQPIPGPTGRSLWGARMLPSQSDKVTLVVQEKPVTPYVSPPLPSEYWTRPIYATNYEWAKVAGSWYGLRAPAFATTGMYDAMGNFNPYTTAPNTPHIMWTMPTHFGGQPGMPIEPNTGSNYMTTTILVNYFEPIILNGILYFTEFAGPNSEIIGWKAVDLRTGNVLWSKPAGISGKEVLRMGQILQFHSQQEFGCWAFLWSCYPMPSLFMPTRNFLIYDAYTGTFLANVTNVENPSFLIDTSSRYPGTLVAWYTEGDKLYKWNSTRLMMSKSFDMMTIRPRGIYDWADGIEWSMPLPKFYNTSIPFSVAAVTPEVVLLRYAPTPEMWLSMSLGWQITAGIDAKTGQLLWGPKNQTLPYLHTIPSFLICARDGVYVLLDKDTFEVYGYSLETGDKLWGPIKLPCNAMSHIWYSADIAYGKVFIWDYGGYVNCLDLKTGKLLWTFTRGSAGYDTPYGVYMLWGYGTHSIADGKLFLFEGKMYDVPMCPNLRLLAIDVNNGSLVWSILFHGGRSPAAVADGMLVAWNCYDAQIYCFGKGPTETTVTVTPEVATEGGNVLIKGTVIDISPGTRQNGVIERFPKGLPAVADVDMKAWMEYVYMQQPKPDKVEGVTVKLYAVKENGESMYIGETKTDPLNGGIFSFSWSPQECGIYRIVALFDGSESYWGSYTSAVVCVTSAPPAPAAAEQAEFTQILVTALIVIAVVCLCLVAYDIHINRKMLKQATK